MKTYNKEKLNEYAKELFALCLRKGFQITYSNNQISIYLLNEIEIENYRYSYLSEDLFKHNFENCVPIWELIEKVKAL